MLLVALSIAAVAAHSGELVSLGGPGLAGSGTNAPAAVCVLGNTVGFGNLLGMLSPGDAHYLFLDPARCPDCNSRIALQNFVLKVFSDPQGPGCSFTLRASVVGALGPPSCPTPDPDVVLCGPQSGTFTPPNDYFEAVIPASEGCCINEPAFLRVEVIAADECARLGLTAAGGCQPCQMYWYQGSTSTYFDTCTLGFTHGFWAEGDCCGAVPVDEKAWGTIKTLYR
jgi:hypothetical protein